MVTTIVDKDVEIPLTADKLYDVAFLYLNPLQKTGERKELCYSGVRGDEVDLTKNRVLEGVDGVKPEVDIMKVFNYGAYHLYRSNTKVKPVRSLEALRRGAINFE